MRDSSHLLQREGHQVFFGADQITGALPAHDGYFCLPGMAGIGSLTSFKRVKAFEEDLFREVQKISPDLIHWVDLFDHRFMRRLSREYPSVMTAHTVAPTCPSSQRFIPAGGVCTQQSGWSCLITHEKQKCLSHFKSVFHRAHALFEFQLKKRVLKTFPTVIAISRYVQNCLLNEGWTKEQVPLVYNPVSIKPLSSPSLQNPPKNLLIVASRLVALKGIGPLLVNLSYLREEEWTLWIFGEGPLKPELQTLSEKLGLSQKIVFHGKQSPETVRQALSSARLLIQPNRGPEGFGMAVAEASAMGVPVVAYQVPALDELIESETNGLLVPLSHPQGLSDAIRKLLKDNLLKNQLSERGPQFMKERFSPENHLRRTLEAYQHCCQQFTAKHSLAASPLAMDC